MNDLLLHPTTAHQLQALLQAKPHAVLISGRAGAGKQAVADVFVTAILGDNAAQNAYFLHISPPAGSIGIEDIRRIRDFLNRKTIGTADIKRLILISDAHAMTGEAQNALLKTLEEPPADTMVLLTVNDVTALRHTIRSRAQQLLVLPVSQEAASKYFEAANHASAAIQAAYYMSDGHVGLLKALLESNGEHALVAAIAQAKALLKLSPYERLAQLDALSKQKEELDVLLQGMERVVLSGMRQAADKQQTAATKKFYQLSKKTTQAQDLLAKNVNPKLVLTALFLDM